MLWCSVYLYYTALLNKARTQVLCIADLCKELKVFNLFRLLENETLKIFSIRERRKSRHKFGGTKVCKAEEVRKYFVNPKTEIEVFRYIICSLDFKNMSCTLFFIWKRWIVSFRGTYWLSITYFILLRVFRFFLFFSFFLFFLWVWLLAEVLR